MLQQPLVILASSRKESDTESFLNKVFEYIYYDKIDLLDYNIAPFNYSNTYPRNDQFDKVVDRILEHQVIVFATPVYWYSMSGLLKGLFDRFTDLITAKKQIGRQLEGKSIFLIAVGADKEMPEGFEVPFSLTADYLNQLYQGSIYYSTKSAKSTNDFDNRLTFFRDKIKKYYS